MRRNTFSLADLDRDRGFFSQGASIKPSENWASADPNIAKIMGNFALEDKGKKIT